MRFSSWSVQHFQLLLHALRNSKTNTRTSTTLFRTASEKRIVCPTSQILLDGCFQKPAKFSHHFEDPSFKLLVIIIGEDTEREWHCCIVRFRKWARFPPFEVDGVCSLLRNAVELYRLHRRNTKQTNIDFITATIQNDSREVSSMLLVWACRPFLLIPQHLLAVVVFLVSSVDEPLRAPSRVVF